MIRILVIEMSTLIILDDYPMKPGVYDAVLEGCFVLVPKLAPPTYQIDFGSEDPSDYSTIWVYYVTVYHDTRKEAGDKS